MDSAPTSKKLEFLWEGKLEEAYIVRVPQAFGGSTTVSFFNENAYTFVTTGGHALNVAIVSATVDSSIEVFSWKRVNKLLFAELCQLFIALLPQSLREGVCKELHFEVPLEIGTAQEALEKLREV